MVEAPDARLPRFGGGGRCDDVTQRANPTIAEGANALEVYEDAVQEPLLECSNLASMYYQAQPIGSTRPEAKILREDFCSSAIIAQTWLGLSPDHHAQGVDIDLTALKIAKRRLESTKREDRSAIFVQSPAFSSAADDSQAESGVRWEVQPSPDTSAQASSSTWAEGAASERFERRFQARLSKKKAKQSGQLSDRDLCQKQRQTLTLLHADVLELPLVGTEVESPDLIYAGNYALSYFHDRKALIAYLSQCRRTLRQCTGTLIVDPFAGPTGWDADTIEERQEQDRLWKKFSEEPGFLRPGEVTSPSALKGDVLEFWKADFDTQPPGSSSDWKLWPRGRLVLVRRGNVNGGYEYWREDGPLDYATNRFRMSLSFRFRDGSWLRDYFSYDFRVWSLREIVEAMYEVGFERVAIHAIPRTVASADLDVEGDSNEQIALNGMAATQSTCDSHQGGADDGLDGMADLLRQTEINECEKHTYKELGDSEKLFAKRSFGTYIVACMPSDGP